MLYWQKSGIIILCILFYVNKILQHWRTKGCIREYCLHLGTSFSKRPESALEKKEEPEMAFSRSNSQIPLARPFWHYMAPFTMASSTSFVLAQCALGVGGWQAQNADTTGRLTRIPGTMWTCNTFTLLTAVWWGAFLCYKRK